MAKIFAKGLVDHLARAGYVVTKRAAETGGGATLGRGFEGQ